MIALWIFVTVAVLGICGIAGGIGGMVWNTANDNDEKAGISLLVWFASLFLWGIGSVGSIVLFILFLTGHYG